MYHISEKRTQLNGHTQKVRAAYAMSLTDACDRGFVPKISKHIYEQSCILFLSCASRVLCGFSFSSSRKKQIPFQIPIRSWNEDHSKNKEDLNLENCTLCSSMRNPDVAVYTHLSLPLPSLPLPSPPLPSSLPHTHTHASNKSYYQASKETQHNCKTFSFVQMTTRKKILFLDNKTYNLFI